MCTDFEMHLLVLALNMYWDQLCSKREAGEHFVCAMRIGGWGVGEWAGAKGPTPGDGVAWEGGLGWVGLGGGGGKEDGMDMKDALLTFCPFLAGTPQLEVKVLAHGGVHGARAPAHSRTRGGDQRPAQEHRPQAGMENVEMGGGCG